MNGKAFMQDGQIAGRHVQTTPTPSTLPDNTTFELLAPPTITSAPQLIDIIPPGLSGYLHGTPTQVDAQGSTVILMPAIIETALPNTPQGRKDVILPFHIQVWEYCFDGARLASGVYTNGNMAQSLDFKDGKVNVVSHRVPGYAPDLSIGAFDYKGSRVRFGYPWKKEGDGKGEAGCEWFDNEMWKSCGECRAKLWSAPALHCEDKAAKGMRVKDMDCSVLLGTKQRFELDGLP